MVIWDGEKGGMLVVRQGSSCEPSCLAMRTSRESCRALTTDNRHVGLDT